MSITPEREIRFKDAIGKRQFNLTVVLENVHDPHNIGAVLRTCDSVGISEIYVIYTDPSIDITNIEIGKNSSSGANKWVKVHFSSDIESCLKSVKARYKNLYATHLAKDSVSLYDLNLVTDAALIFGNERDGLSEVALSYCNKNFIIPQHGLVRSLNISVACAVSLYEAQRQRNDVHYYANEYQDNNPSQSALYEKYLAIHQESRLKKS